MTENKNNDANLDTMSRNKMSIDVVSQMQNMVSHHLSALENEDEKVENIISSSGTSADLLREAKNIAFDNAISLFGPLKTLKELAEFLQDIVKIENCFNDLYKALKTEQETARKSYAPNIQNYENNKHKLENQDIEVLKH